MYNNYYRNLFFIFFSEVGVVVIFYNKKTYNFIS